mmetsp:Transcript_34672/g.82129  ORF Transcript_34672/g.82129 Transcript_34672/m.82129 type:complete len:156 (+) Transcript_34672:379-846(+)
MGHERVIAFQTSDGGVAFQLGDGYYRLSHGTLLVAGAAVLALVALPSAAIFLASWRRGGGRRALPDDSGEVKVLLKLTADEARHGCEKQVSFNAAVKGDLIQRTATLNVPRGVTDGHVIRLPGWGASRKTQPDACGDLVLEIVVEDAEEEDIVLV